MNKIRFLLIILSAAASIACSTRTTTKPGTAFTPIAADSKHAVVYIYRPPVMANMIYTPELYINDEYRIPLRSGENYHFTLKPGSYNLTLKHETIEANELSTELFTAGSIYYYRVTTSLKLNDTAQYQPYQRQFKIMAMDASLAKQQIASCCLKDKPAKTKPDDNERDKTNNNNDGDTGFSVDKTQNPFSH